MSALSNRFKETISRLGDDYNVSGQTRRAIVTVLPSERASALFSDAELAEFDRPLRLAYVAHDDGTIVDDTVSWDGLSLNVKKVVRTRARGEIVAKMLVWA